MSAATWEFFADPAAFLDAAGAHLAADPVLATTVTTTAQRLADAAAQGQPVPAHPCWFAVARAGGGVVGVAMRTSPFPPHPLYVLPMPDDVAAALADALAARGEPVTGANGALPAARVVVGRSVGAGRSSIREGRPIRLYEVRRLVPPPRPAPGAARRAVEADVELVRAWYEAFHPDAERQAGRPPAHGPAPTVDHAEARRRVLAGRLWLWEDDGVPVAMAGVAGPALGVARVAPVYTPAAHRGRGYAGALVAHVTRGLLDAGHRVCLFTDRDNPVSNALYVRLGYEPVVDLAELRVG
jgi:GNAT superfamily N-acetyltransferase